LEACGIGWEIGFTALDLILGIEVFRLSSDLALLLGIEAYFDEEPSKLDLSSIC
jgi:hypothetical protein